MLRLQPIALLAILVAGCSHSVPEEEIAINESALREMPLDERKERFEENADESVGYYNPDTGTRSNYDLNVEYSSDGDVERINFPNGGWIDDFVDQTDNGDGTLTVETDDGREFVVPKFD